MPSHHWASNPAVPPNTAATSSCVVLPKKCAPCATKWQIQIQIIHLFFKNFLRTYTHVRGNFYNFICISVSSVSFNPQNYCRKAPHRQRTRLRADTGTAPPLQALLVDGLWPPPSWALYPEATRSWEIQLVRIVIQLIRTRISCIYHPGTADLRTYQLYSSANSF